MSKKYLLISILLCALLPLGVLAQVITVVDSESEEPLELVTIVSESPKLMVITNGEGQADLSEFKKSKGIQIRLLGYEPQQLTFEAIQSNQFVIRLAPSNINLEQIVISGTRWLQPNRDTPVKITGLSAKDVTRENPMTTADLLAASGEVFVQKSQLGGGSPMIRGFSANRLLYVVDGVRMNTAIFRSGNLQNVISLDAYSLERTEILYGPGSVMYGSDAIGAVMSFQTLRPQFSLNDKMFSSGKAVARYSSASNEKTGHLAVSLGWEKWATVTSITASDFDDLKMGSDGPDDYLRPFYVKHENGQDVIIENSNQELQVPTGYSQLNFMQKVAYKHSDKWIFDYGFHYSTSSDIPRYDRLIRTRNNEPRSAEWHYGPQIWMMNNLSISHKSEHLLFNEASFRIAHQYFEESRVDRDFNDPIRSTRTEEVQAISANLDFIKERNNTSNLLYGLEFVTNDVVSKGELTDIETGLKSKGPARYPNSTWQSFGAYITYQQQLKENLNLSTGLRYSLFSLNSDYSNNIAFYPLPFNSSQLTDGALTGSIGFTYHPTEKWSIHLQGATAYRAPNVDDSGKIFDSEPGAVVVPNTDLQAEYAYNAEIGAARVFGEWLKIDMAAYYTFLDNAMVRRPYEINGQDSIVYEGELSQVQAVQNAAQATVYGIQLGAELKLPHGFSISSRYNIQVGEEEMSNGAISPSRHAAPAFGSTRLNYTYKKFELELSCLYTEEVEYNDLPVSEQGKDYLYALDKNGNPYAPKWYTIHLRSAFHINPVITVAGGIENITDQRYRPYSSGISAPGRNYYISLTGRF